MIFDGHSDLLYDVTRRRLAGENCVLERRHRQKLRKGRIGGLGLSLWVTAEPDSFWAAYPGWDGWRRTEEMMACFQAELADSPWLVPVRTAAEAREVQAAGKTFAFLAVEGMEPVGNRLERLEQYARWGARIGMLTWNEENRLAAGAGGDPENGLTELGWEAVRRMQRLGIVPDVSHASDGTFRDLLKLAEGPVIASHSNCRGAVRCPAEPDRRSAPGHPGYRRGGGSQCVPQLRPCRSAAADGGPCWPATPPTWRRLWGRNTWPAALTSVNISAPATRAARGWRIAARPTISSLNWNASGFQRRSVRPSQGKICCGCWNRK